MSTTKNHDSTGLSMIRSTVEVTILISGKLFRLEVGLVDLSLEGTRFVMEQSQAKLPLRFAEALDDAIVALPA